MDRLIAGTALGLLLLQCTCTCLWSLSVNVPSAAIPSLVMPYVRDVVGKGIGKVPGYQTLGLFGEWRFGSWQPYLDLRGHHLQHDQWGTNTGLGIRYFDSKFPFVFGINAFHDYLSQSPSMRYHQLGVGIEWSYSRYRLVVNGYAPVGCRTYLSSTKAFTYPGDYVAICRSETKALPGVDIELSGLWTRELFSRPLGLRLSAGGYRYENKCDCFLGERVRLEVMYSSWFLLGAVQTCDEAYKSTLQVYLTLRFPLDRIGRLVRWFYPAVRQEIIIRDTSTCQWTTNY